MLVVYEKGAETNTGAQTSFSLPDPFPLNQRLVLLSKPVLPLTLPGPVPKTRHHTPILASAPYPAAPNTYPLVPS